MASVFDSIQGFLQRLRETPEQFIDPAAIPPALVGGIQGAPDLGTSLQDTLDKVGQGVGNTNDAGFNPDVLKDLFAANQQQIADINANLAALRADQGGQQNSGESATVRISDYADGAVPAVFTKVVDSGSGNALVSGGVLDFSDSVVGTEHYVYNVKALETDYPQVSVSMPRQPGSTWFGYSTGSNYLYLIARANVAGTQFYFARIGFNTIRVGYYNNGTITLFGSNVSYSAPAGALITFRAGTAGGIRQFHVLVNNQIKAVFSDDAAVGVIDDSHRYCGWGLQADDDYLPGTIAIWTMNDNTPSSTVGCGFRAYRTSTSASANIGAGAVAPGWTLSQLPGGMFPVIDRITSDMSYNSSTNELTIGISGWYLPGLSFQWESDANSGERCAPVFYVDSGSGFTAVVAGNQWGLPTYSTAGNGSIAQNQNMVGGGPPLIYLAAGWKIKPGLARTGGVAKGIIGDAGGLFTWFSCVLLNRSLA